MSDASNSKPPKPPLPIHAVTKDADGSELVVRRRPGRPRVVRPRPSADEELYVEAINKLRQEHVERDHLVCAERTEDILRQVVRGIAEETACLRWQVEKGRLDPRAQEQARSRRVDGLQKIANVLLTARRLGVEPDIAKQKIRLIAALWLQMIREAAASLPQEHVEPFVARVEKEMSKWLASMST